MARKGTHRVSLAFNRRDFLRTTVAVPAAAGAAYFAYQKLEGGPMRTVLVGAGKQGREALIRQAPLGYIDYVGFLEPRPSQSDLAWREFADLYGSAGVRRVKHYGKWEEILDDKSVEAVAIATPTPTHARLAIEAMKAGKHVYCEAPMSDGVLSAKAMARIARDTGKILAIGHQRGANPKYREAAQHLLDDTLGEVRYIETLHHVNVVGADPWYPPIPATDESVPATQLGYASVRDMVHWRGGKDSGGMFAEMATQQLDAVRLIVGNRFGLPIAVRGGGDKTLSSRETSHPDHAYLLFEYENDRLAVSWTGISGNASEGQTENVLGTRGTLWIRDAVDLQLAAPPAPPPPGGAPPPKTTGAVAVSVDAASKGVPTMYSAASAGYTAAAKQGGGQTSQGFAESLRQFAECVRGKGNVGCAPEQGVYVLALALAAQKAVEQRKRVVIESDWFKLDSTASPDGKPLDSAVAKEVGRA
jgi:predicted dehydrogenase